MRYEDLPVQSFRIRMAELVFEIRHRYEYIHQRCQDYIVPEDTPADFVMQAEAEHFARTLALWQRSLPVDPDALAAQVEFSCVPVAVYGQLPLRDALWLHATVVGYRGNAYAFTAPSGYGKTTHARMWLEAFGNEAQIINGDMPILRLRNGVFHAYGTPFCGKEQLQKNVGLPLRGICFLTHSGDNRIRRMDPALAMAQLFHDNPMNSHCPEAHLDLYTRLVESVPVYQLYCSISPEAARVALQAMQP